MIAAWQALIEMLEVIGACPLSCEDILLSTRVWQVMDRLTLHKL